MGKRKMTYSEALASLENLAERIKRDEIPIEELPAEIKKAKELLEYCSLILRNIEQELQTSESADAEN
ncbi:MAG: exodeoxyribonuclease VII small subunit [Saprospiraceae bacterium]|nr:exodeoxyribonuclease VII small subunit [Saprospiraceae bacterium]